MAGPGKRQDSVGIRRVLLLQCIRAGGGSATTPGGVSIRTG